MNIKNIKEQVRLLKLSNPNMSAYQILKKRKFVLGHLPTEQCDELPEGCYFKEGFLRTVLIHPDVDDDNSKFVYTHELGHSIEHPEINTMRLELYDPVFVQKIELEADTFAAEFLLEDDVFLRYPHLSNEGIAKKEKVLLKHVELKLKNLDKAYLPERYQCEYECALDF